MLTDNKIQGTIPEAYRTGLLYLDMSGMPGVVSEEVGSQAFAAWDRARPVTNVTGHPNAVCYASLPGTNNPALVLVLPRCFDFFICE